MMKLQQQQKKEDISYLNLYYKDDCSHIFGVLVMIWFQQLYLVGGHI